MTFGYKCWFDVQKVLFVKELSQIILYQLVLKDTTRNSRYFIQIQLPELALIINMSSQ